LTAVDIVSFSFWNEATKWLWCSFIDA